MNIYIYYICICTFAVRVIGVERSSIIPQFPIGGLVTTPRVCGSQVGLYRGPFFAALELQGRWACGVFSGRLQQLSQEPGRLKYG